MIIDKHGSTLTRYWSLEDNSQWQYLDDETLLTEFQQRFRQAVAVRLESDYPLSAELSEGLDSNDITGMAATLRPEQTIHTLSYQCIALTETTRPVWEKNYQYIRPMLDMYDNLKPVWQNGRFTTNQAEITRLIEATAEEAITASQVMAISTKVSYSASDNGGHDNSYYRINTGADGEACPQNSGLIYC